MAEPSKEIDTRGEIESPLGADLPSPGDVPAACAAAQSPQVSASDLAAVCQHLATVGTAIQRLAHSIAPPPTVVALRSAVAHEIIRETALTGMHATAAPTQSLSPNTRDAAPGRLVSPSDPAAPTALDPPASDSAADERDIETDLLSDLSTPHNSIGIDLITPAVAKRLKLHQKRDPDSFAGSADDDEHYADRVIQTMFARFSEENAMEMHRRLLIMPGEPQIEAVRALIEQAPHMAGMVQAFADALALHHKAAQPFRIAPTIVVGPPGAGKTWLVQAICSAIGLPCLALPMTIMTAAFAWTGSHRTWRSATPGIVAKQLIENPVANPVIFVDEFDKASARNDDHNVYNAFYTLLEQATAAEFVDEFLMAPIDASHISWLFTANDLSAIPSAILDRLNVVQVKAPALEQRRRILTAIYRDANAKFASMFDPAPSNDFLAALNAGSLRHARRDVEAAMARAAGADRSRLLPSDLPNGRKFAIGLV